MNPTPNPPASVVFGRFRVVSQRRELLADGQPLKLGGRAYDVLMTLIGARGAVVSRDALMSSVWPDRVVEESALEVQISALRAVFGADRALIRTVAGRGYQFTGEIRIQSGDSERCAGAVVVATPAPAVVHPTNLPEPVSELIARGDELQEILGLAADNRLVTLTGAGGIGKTQLALEAARTLRPDFADGAWVVELAPLSDPVLIPVAFASALGLEISAGTVSPKGVAAALSAKKILLVLDNCEHVIDAAATITETLLQVAPGLRLIATSREPLRVEGEQVYPVPPLGIPAEHAEGNDDPLRYGAVRLFLERARAAAPRFAPDQHQTTLVATICRRLDGIPLAIELAAARVPALGTEELVMRLDDRFQWLMGGRRTALPRHQTLRATLDWSHDLLSEGEKLLFRRLGVFASNIDLKAAVGITSDADLTPEEVVEHLSNLVTKSLLAVHLDTPVPRFRLVETTRAYALEKLAASGESERLTRRAAEYGRDRLERAQATLESRPTADLLISYRYWVDNLRWALDWAFSPEGDASVGVALTAAAVPLWMHLSLVEECRLWVEQALAALAGSASPDERLEMRLQAAQGALLVMARGAGSADSGAVWTKTLAIAERLDDVEYQLRALWGLWLFRVNSGRHRIPLELAERFLGLAPKLPASNDPLFGQRMIGVSLYLRGDLAAARDQLEHVLAEYADTDERSQTVRFQFDLRVSVRVFVAWILWLQGLADQAIHVANEAVEDARATNQAFSLCYALAFGACPIAFLIGDLTAAEQNVGLLADQSARYGLTLWSAVARAHQGLLRIEQGDVVAGSALLQTGLDEAYAGAGLAVRLITCLHWSTEPLRRADRVDDELSALEDAIDRSRATDEYWAMAELLRIKGELLLLQDAPGAMAMAEERFRQALDRARQQGALSWELRAATSLARLLRDQGRSADAKALLQPVYDRFSEGFQTADLKTARELLGTFRVVPR